MAEFGMGTGTGDLGDFHIGFLDPEGALIQTMSLKAETLTGATDSAEEIARNINAADFFVTAGSRAAVEPLPVAPRRITKLFIPLSRLIFSHASLD